MKFSQKIILIETSDIGATYTAEAVKHLGFEPIFLAQLNNYQGDTLAQIKKHEHYDIDTTSVEAMLQFIRQQDWKIAAVTTFLDSRLHLAIELAEQLNVRGLEPSLKAFKDKARVDELGTEFCPPSVIFNRDSIPANQIENLRKKFGTIILKPRCTAGGIGARSFTSNESFSNIISHIQCSEISEHLQPDEWMAQAFINGELISGEGYVRGGKIKILGFSGRRKIENTESWVGFPYDDQLNDRVLEDARRKITKMLEASRIQNAFFHIELMVNKTEAYVIDANLGRMGGGGVGEVFASAYQVSPIEIFKNVLSISLFPEHHLAPFWDQRPVAAVSVAYGLRHEARLRELPKKATKNIFNTCILHEGALVPSMGTNNWAWVGIVSGSSQAVRNFLSEIKIKTDAGDQPAYFAFAEESECR